MTGLIIGMVICLAVVFASTNSWMGEMVGGAMEGDEPHPIAFAGLLATGASVIAYLWLGSIILTR